MKRASAGLFGLLSGLIVSVLIVGFTPHAYAYRDALLQLEAGENISPSIHVLDKKDCQDLKPVVDNQKDEDDARASEPVAQSKVDEKSVEKPGFKLGLFNFKPDGSPRRLRTEECSADHLQDLLLENSSAAHQTRVIEKFFKNTCRQTVRRQGDGNIGAMLKATASVYNACENPRVHAVSVGLPDGTKLRGLLALQDSKTPRPLIIFKEGAFGNANSASGRQILMTFFDQGPFHVLNLGNSTGSDYLRDNQHLAIGGFEEGQQILRVVEMLRHSKIASRISEIQVIGVSLGGEAALFASYYNQHQPKINGKAPITSVFAMSPVVDLQASMESLFGSQTKWKIIRKVILADFFDILRDIPGLKTILSDLDGVSAGAQVPDIIATGAVEYYSKASTTSGLAPYEDMRITSESSLWKRNDFLATGSADLATPTMVLTADDDWVVNPEENSYLLKAAIEKNPARSQVSVATLGRGNHCAFGPALGWDLFTSMMTSWELAHSPSLLAKRHFETEEISDDYAKKFHELNDDEITVAYHFQFSKDKDYMKITIDQVDDEHLDDQFCDLDPEELASDCLKRTVVKIPLDELPSWARQPVNNTDAQALTRWVNTNVRLVSDDGTLIGHNNKNPRSFRWVSYE